jgi:5-methylcytosine-specific restriction endonuclease McrA
MIQPKNRARPIRLSDDAYRALCAKVLERDGWRCQDCGRRDRLQIHHILHRSQSGMDCEENLIVFCSDCHRHVHSWRSAVVE